MTEERTRFATEVVEALAALDFERARHLVREARARRGDAFLRHTLHTTGYDDGAGLAAYTLVWTLLADGEEAVWHDVAAGLLSGPLMHEPHALASAVFHARRACELAPDIAEHWEVLVSDIGGLPSSPLSREERAHAARQLLRIKPDSALGQAFADLRD